MALYSTSDRYNYIFGSAVRKQDNPDLVYRNRVISEPGPAVRKSPVPRTSPQYEPQPARRARKRKRAAHALDFDWKYTVIATLATFLIIACAIFYVKGTVTLHNLYGQVTELKEEKTRLLGKQTALKSEIDKAMNLDEIRTYAKKNLNMVSPGQKQIIYYTDSNNDYIRQYESVDTGR